MLGEAPTLTQDQVAEAAGVPRAVPDTLWRLLGFPSLPPDEVAFTPADVRAVEATQGDPALKAFYEKIQAVKAKY